MTKTEFETTKNLLEIYNLERRVAMMKKPGPVINVESDGLEPEIEKIMFDLVEKAQIKATEEGLRSLMGYDEIEKLDAVAASLLADFHGNLSKPDKCFICERSLLSYFNDWYSDGNGNIVHKNCYKGEVT